MQMEGWFILGFGLGFFLPQEEWGLVETTYSKMETYWAPSMQVPK